MERPHTIDALYNDISTVYNSNILHTEVEVYCLKCPYCGGKARLRDYSFIYHNNKYKGIYVVESMPAEYKPSWELLTEARQQEIIRSSKMYDFTKEGVLESFWANVNFSKDETKQVNENHNDPVNSYQNNIVARMKALRGLNV